MSSTVGFGKPAGVVGIGGLPEDKEAISKYGRTRRPMENQQADGVRSLLSNGFNNEGESPFAHKPMTKQTPTEYLIKKTNARLEENE